jgi:hypothetical protein
MLRRCKPPIAAGSEASHIIGVAMAYDATTQIVDVAW